MKGFATFQVILLSVFGALAVAGVLIFAVASSSNTSKTSVGNIVIWGTLDETAFNTVLRTTADVNADIAGVTYVVKDEKSYEQSLTNALAKNTGPDLFVLRSDYAYNNAPKISSIPYTAISREQFQNGFVSAADPFLSANGVLGIPFLVDPLVLYWNKDILSSAGIAAPPRYWSQLFDMATQVNQKSDSGTLSRSLIALGEYDNVDHAKDIVSLLVMQAGGKITTYDDAGKLNAVLNLGGSTNAQAAATSLRFYTEFADPSKQNYSWNRSLPHSLQAFSNGDLALYIGYASEASKIATTNPNLQFAVAPLPQIEDTTHTNHKVGFAHVYAFAAAQNSKHVNSAVTAAYDLTTQSVAALFSTSFNIPSARRDILSSSTIGTLQVLNNATINAVSWIDPSPDGTDTIFQAMISDVTSGAVLVNEAVQRADGQIRQLISQQQE